MANLKGNTTRHPSAITAIHAPHLARHAMQATPLSYSPSATPLAHEHNPQIAAASALKISPNLPQSRRKEKLTASPKSSLHLPSCESKPLETTLAQISSQLPHAPIAVPTTNIEVLTAETHTCSAPHPSNSHITTGTSQNPSKLARRNFMPKPGTLAPH
jgi:hypothetical protein